MLEPRLPCPYCQGRGQVYEEHPRFCPDCAGSGGWTALGWDGETQWEACVTCGGLGSVLEGEYSLCPYCGGQGWLRPEEAQGVPSPGAGCLVLLLALVLLAWWLL